MDKKRKLKKYIFCLIPPWTVINKISNGFVGKAIVVIWLVLPISYLMEFIPINIVDEYKRYFLAATIFVFGVLVNWMMCPERIKNYGEESIYLNYLIINNKFIRIASEFSEIDAYINKGKQIDGLDSLTPISTGHKILGNKAFTVYGKALYLIDNNKYCYGRLLITLLFLLSFSLWYIKFPGFVLKIFNGGA